MKFDKGVESAWWALRIGLGVAAAAAGADKFFNLLADWEGYLSPVAQRFLPVSAVAFMHVAGIVEIVVGLAILTRWTREASYVAAAWLTLIALNLLTTGQFLDVAVRDVVMAIAAYTLARLTEARESTRASEVARYGSAATRASAA
jgi:uncharacterized membrane protein YphA (DoxX/SURF4 family)